MTQHIGCFITSPLLKNVLRSINTSSIQITNFHNTQEIIRHQNLASYSLFIIDGKYNKQNELKTLLMYLTQNDLNRITMIIPCNFNKESFRKYIQLGYTYIIDRNVFTYLIPVILENLAEFLHHYRNSSSIHRGNLTLSVANNYLIFKECKILLSKIDVLILQMFLNSPNPYINTTALQGYLASKLNMNISNSYITVNLSRLNHKVSKATGIKLIKSRYGHGYYLSI